MDAPYQVIGGKKRFTDKVEFVAEQTDHITALKANYTTGDLDTEAEIITALNAINTALNKVLVILEDLGRIKTS